MKKTILAFALVLSMCAPASVKTNWVYVVSNIYNNVYSENVVTQKVKNTHYNYYYTNYVSVVTNTSVILYRTNLSVNCDVSSAYVVAASNQANRAEIAMTNAQTFAGSAASSATAAAASASSASSSASSANATRSAAASECSSAIATINSRINWFDEHMGGRIDNYTWTTNISYYYAEDSTARSMAVENANAITNLQNLAPIVTVGAVEKSAAYEVATNATSYFPGSMSGVFTNKNGRTLVRTYPQTARIRVRWYGLNVTNDTVVDVTNRGSMQDGKWFNYSFSDMSSGYPKVVDAYFAVNSRIFFLDCQMSNSATDIESCMFYSDNSTQNNSLYNNKVKTLTRFHPFPYVGMNLIVNMLVGTLTGAYHKGVAVVESITEDKTGELVDDYYVNSDFTFSGVDDDYVFDRQATKDEIVNALINVMSRLGR